MNIFKLPKHPEANTPERRKNAKARIAAALGGIAVTYASFTMSRKLPPLDGIREHLSLPMVAGVSVTALMIIAELQERYKSGGSGGGGPDDDPSSPTPTGPQFGAEFDWALTESEFSKELTPV